MNRAAKQVRGALACAALVASGCERAPERVERGAGSQTSAPGPSPSAPAPSVSAAPVAARQDTCAGPYASRWNDPSNTPPAGASRVFRLSQAFPKTLPPIDAQPWLAANPFDASTLEARRAESDKYIRAVLAYVLEGNVGDSPAESDFELCNNPVRPWFHVPWMDANRSKGREYVHGLTRELASSKQKLGPGQQNVEASWAVGFYNARGAFAIGGIFPGESASDVRIPTAHVAFPEGTVVGKVLFTTASVASVPHLAGAPVWQANILPPPCGGTVGGTATAPDGTKVECVRSLHAVSLAQLDVAVVDARSPLRWTFGTFIYDASAGQGWRGLRPVGLMWGNDPALQPLGTRPDKEPPAQRGLTPPERVQQSVMFTDTLPAWFQKDLGCAGRLDGPIDNPRSSCMSCHASASVPLELAAGDTNPCTGTKVSTASVVRAPLLDFGKQCGSASVDAIWFRNLAQSTPITAPEICRGTSWISLDYSLQVGEALANFLVARSAGALAVPATPPPAALPPSKAASPKARLDLDVRR